jgi:multimeric flavodoxin WrbA
MGTAKHLLIVYHSGSGHTETMAKAVITGAQDEAIEGVEVVARRALEADRDDVMWADGIILGTPENFGYMSGAMKVFFDTIYYPCLEHTQGLPYGVFIRAGNDGQGALSSVTRIITGLGWRQVCEPIIFAGDFDDRRLVECTELGMSLAVGLETGVF